MKYHYGVVESEQKRDESGVAGWELANMLRGLGLDQRSIATRTGVDEGFVSKMFSGKQKFVSLLVADRMLFALGITERLGELTVIPGHTRADAIQMAVYENLDENDELQATEAEVEARADELQALREQILAAA